MSSYMFNPGRGRLTDQAIEAIDRIARKHGCVFEAVRLPEGYRHWFAGPNRGEPFDRAMGRAVIDDLQAAGLYDDDGPVASCYARGAR